MDELQVLIAAVEIAQKKAEESLWSSFSVYLPDLEWIATQDLKKLVDLLIAYVRLRNEKLNAKTLSVETLHEEIETVELLCRLEKLAHIAARATKSSELRNQLAQHLLRNLIDEIKEKSVAK